MSAQQSSAVSTHPAQRCQLQQDWFGSTSSSSPFCVSWARTVVCWPDLCRRQLAVRGIVEHGHHEVGHLWRRTQDGLGPTYPLVSGNLLALFVHVVGYIVCMCTCLCMRAYVRVCVVLISVSVCTDCVNAVEPLYRGHHQDPVGCPV